jgi:hypothetical protein
VICENTSSNKNISKLNAIDEKWSTDSKHYDIKYYRDYDMTSDSLYDLISSEEAKKIFKSQFEDSKDTFWKAFYNKSDKNLSLIEYYSNKKVVKKIVYKTQGKIVYDYSQASRTNKKYYIDNTEVTKKEFISNENVIDIQKIENKKLEIKEEIREEKKDIQTDSQDEPKHENDTSQQNLSAPEIPKFNPEKTNNKETNNKEKLKKLPAGNYTTKKQHYFFHKKNDKQALGKLNKGTSIQIIKSEKEWYLFDVLFFIPNYVVENSTISVSSDQKVIIRDKPNGKLIGKLKPKTKVTIQYQEGEWLYCNISGYMKIK